MMNVAFVHRRMLHSGLSWSRCVTAMILATYSVESLVCTAPPPPALAVKRHGSGRMMHGRAVEKIKPRLGLRSEECLPVKNNLSHTAMNPDVPNEIHNTDEWFIISLHTVTNLQNCASQEEWYEVPWYLMFP